MSIERYYRQFTPVCDYCGERLPGEESFDAAVRAKREAGWESRKVNGEWEDICTDCQWEDICIDCQFEEKGYGNA